MRNPIPVWVIILLFLLLYWGMVYFDTQGGWQPIVYKPYHSAQEVVWYQPLPPEGPNLQNGKQMFETICGICHNNDGSGKPGQAPPLAGSEWVAEPVNRMAAIPLTGLSGPITVKGQQFNLSMPNLGSTTDENLADILSYIRSSWGNKATPATPAEIKAVRASLASHPQPMSADEVKKRPEK